MRRRLISLSLLAYPRRTRQADGVYLRDLALELAEGDGLPRQLLSLLMSGIKERLGSPRSRRSAAIRWVVAGVSGVAIVVPVALALYVPSEIEVGMTCVEEEVITASDHVIEVECRLGA